MLSAGQHLHAFDGAVRQSLPAKARVGAANVAEQTGIGRELPHGGVA